MTGTSLAIHSRPRSHARRTLRAVEFFAGIGLVRVALERQKWRVVFANDIDEKKAAMYRSNWPERGHLRVGDIHELSTSDVPDSDLITASFPCTDLSIAGRWAGLNGKESSAFWGLIRVLREMGDRRPPIVMLENVVGFLMSNGGGDLETALRALNELGYEVDAFILNASHWTPQSRARLFVVAKQPSENEAALAAPFGHGRPERLAAFILSRPGLRWNLRALPPLPRRKIALTDVIEDLPDDDARWWPTERAAYFWNQLSPRHALLARLMMGGKSDTYATAFRRVRHGKSMAELRTDGIAGCLRTPKGGSGRQILFRAGSGRYAVRLFTARECARLQGVPASYRIDVPDNQALFGFGDAVCVPTVEWIIKHYLTPQALSYESQPSLFGGGAGPC